MGELLALADAIDACVEDARRPIPFNLSGRITQGPDHRIASLCNALSHVSNALHALASQEPGS